MLQHKIVAAEDQPTAAQNDQNNSILYNSTIIQNIPYNYNILEDAQNLNNLHRYSFVGSFGTAGLVLLNWTSSAIENSSIVQGQPLIMV